MSSSPLALFSSVIGEKPPRPPSKKITEQNRENDDFFLLETMLRMKFGMHVVKILFNGTWLQISHHTHNFDFFGRLKQVGSVLCRSDLDPFIVSFNHWGMTKNDLSLCDTCFISVVRKINSFTICLQARVISLPHKDNIPFFLQTRFYMALNLQMKILLYRTLITNPSNLNVM